jgi:large subunit ribosomal protein L10e
MPQSKIRIFTIGDKSGEYSHRVLLKVTHATEIGSDSLEAARVTANKTLEAAGKPYLFKILVYPHEIVREHKFMGFAGADRLSQGMSRSFGRPTSKTAKTVSDQTIMSVDVKDDETDLAKTALKKAAKKLPISYSIVIEEMAVTKTGD